MKNQVKFFCFLMGLMTFSSCNESSENVENQSVNLKEIDLDLTALRVNSSNLFTYTSKAQLLSEIPRAVDVLYDDAQRELTNNSNLTHVTFLVRFSQGKAVISEVAYVNANSRTIYDGAWLDSRGQFVSNTNSSLGLLPGLPWDAILKGGCPQGYTSLGTCSNTGSTASTRACISTAISTYLSSTISAIGDCAETRVSVGILNTRVSGKTC